MDFFGAAIGGLAMVLSPTALAMLFVGVIFGMVIGFLPGMGGVIAMSLLFPFIYNMELGQAICLLWGAKLAQAQIGIAKVTRVFFGPPNMSVDAVNVFETAFKKILTDKDFTDKAAKAERPILYASGADVTKMIKAAVDQGTTLTPILKEALKAAQ